MTIRLYPNDKRGVTMLGWLKSYHSFSFGSFYKPELMNFGKLLVINDDEIAPGYGFGMHPHKDMEIITIPLSGSLSHTDTAGNEGTVQFGQIQVMSAGTGIRHSEINASETEKCTLLQIWIEPDELSVRPRYEQKDFDITNSQGQFWVIISPINKKEAGSIGIYSSSYISWIKLEKGQRCQYNKKEAGNVMYFLSVEGNIIVNDMISLNSRDAVGMTEERDLTVEGNEEDCWGILFEVPAK
jgi:quercetin 2,3-dioxygenase